MFSGGDRHRRSAEEKLQELIDEGNKSAVYALRLAEEKEELFATIQVGITTISIITGMFSGGVAGGAFGE